MDELMNDGILKTLREEIQEAVGAPAILEGLAEEAIELAHAALKTARILRGENPTDARYENAWAAMTEEFTDLAIYSHILGLSIDYDLYCGKKERMVERIREAKA